MGSHYRISLERYIHYYGGGLFRTMISGQKVKCKSCGSEGGPNRELFIGDEPWKRWLLRHLEAGVKLRGEIYAYCKECL